MKRYRRLAAALLMLTLILGLTACDGEKNTEAAFDAGTYVDGLLRASYLGEYTPEYLELVGITEEEAQNSYENSVNLEAQVFAYLYNIEYPQEFYEEIRELYREIFSHAKFEVVSATQEEDGSFSVRVEVEPIDIVRQVGAGLDEKLKPFFEKYTSEVQNTMTTEDYEAFDAEWARLIVDAYKEALPQTGNLPAQSVTVKIRRDEEGYYGISDEEYKRVSALVIDYSNPAPEPTPTPETSETPSQRPEESPAESPGENDPVPPTTASPLPEPEESEEPAESVSPEVSDRPEESPEGTE